MEGLERIVRKLGQEAAAFFDQLWRSWLLIYPYDDKWAPVAGLLLFAFITCLTLWLIKLGRD